MSKPRYKWWSYIKAVIREYPNLKSKYNDLHSVSITASMSDMPKGTNVSRNTEITALKEMSPTEQKEYEAVRKAIEATERHSNGRDRLLVIDAVLWKATHTLSGAALMVPCSERTAWQWHGEFIRLVASYYGLID
jgi:iron uptake system EfeUOB component EfeO/EfeM